MNAFKAMWSKAILPSDICIQQAIRNLDEVAIKIVLIVNSSGEFVGSISDGDIRRGLLRGLNLNSPITEVIQRNPLVAPPGVGRELIKQLMIANKIQQIPVVDENNHLVDLYLWDEIATTPARSNQMVIMAGGKGIRLRPHTENCPKPMLLVAGKPILEHIIENAKSEGFYRFILATHYLGHIIEDYFGNGNKFNVEIEYLREPAPLGTAGALSLIDPIPNDAFIVTNGDVITDIKYGELLDFHCRNSADATMAVRVHEWQNPYGVVRTNGISIVGFEEKPIVRSHINAGVYALNPNSLNVLKVNHHCDMPTMFEQLKIQSACTLAYPMHEPWLDVGRPDDLEQARAIHSSKN